MAGALLERELTSRQRCGLEFDIAAEADDAEIRRLLRENPMPGKISVSLEREPDYFAAELPGETKQTIVARDGERLACVGWCHFRRRFVNGEPCRVGYLGGLRLDASHAGRFDILRRGYAFFNELQAREPADLYFTTIAADNDRARQFLERGVHGMPRYEFVGEFVTVLIPTHRQRRAAAKFRGEFGVTLASAPDGLAEFVNETNLAYQLAPCWSEAELSRLRELGLNTCASCVLRDGKRTVASAGVWDQRRFKQSVVRGYAPWLAFLRPAFNLFAWPTARTRLPAIGETVAAGFVSLLANSRDSHRALIPLLEELRHQATERGLELLTVGFAANDPRLANICKSFPRREYRSHIYLVRWSGMSGGARQLDGRILAPEVALL
jgi:hypothetical protein